MKVVKKIFRSIAVLCMMVTAVLLAQNRWTLARRDKETTYSVLNMTTRNLSVQHSVPQKLIVDDDDTIARKLSEKVRISCVILSGPQYMDSRVKYVMRTWAKRCTKLAIISTQRNALKEVVVLNLQEGRKHLVEKALGAYRYAYEHHFNDAEWFLMTDDDSYMIMENLRYYLSEQDTNQPLYIGEHFHANVDFITGGAGIILSKEALRIFATSANTTKVCRQSGDAGDLAIGECMTKLGIKPKNSTDVFGKSRFHQFAPEAYNGPFPKWFHKMSVNKVRTGMEWISDYVISFHYVPGNKMDVLEYLIYHARLYGVVKGSKNVNQH